MKNFIKRSINRVNLKKEYILNFFSAFSMERNVYFRPFLILKKWVLKFFLSLKI